MISALMIGVNVPLLRGRIGMNQWYGFRIPKSYSSPQNWYLINAFGARKFIMAAALMIPFAIVEMLLPFGKNSTVVTLCGLAPLIFFVFPIISTFRYAKKL